MATYTRIELRNAVMHDLAVLDAQEAPLAEDAELVTKRVQATLELLNDEGLIPFDLDGDEIPARYLVPLVQVIAPTLLGAFGKLDEKGPRDADAREGMRALRRLKAAPYFGTPAQANYF